MSEVARILRHPEDRDLVVVDVPPSLNVAMAQLPHARLAPEHHGYVMHNESIPGLYRWARHHDVHIADERGGQHKRARVLPVECSRCGQPARLEHQPRVCPACGESWTPVTPPATALPFTRTNCPACSTPQRGRFPFCAACGAPMEHEPQQSTLAPPEHRERLEDPLPLDVESVLPPRP